MGTNASSPQRTESFRHFLLLSSPSVVYHRRKPPNLRVSLGARAAQFQASRVRVRSHAGACSPPAQRTTTGYAGRCRVPRAFRNVGFHRKLATKHQTLPPGNSDSPSPCTYRNLVDRKAGERENKDPARRVTLAESHFLPQRGCAFQSCAGLCMCYELLKRGPTMFASRCCLNRKSAELVGALQHAKYRLCS